MPIYEYRCNECGHQFEVSQRMADDPITECEVCGGVVTKMLFAPAIHFKGTGFHNTDYASKRRGGGDEGGGSNGDGGGSDAAPAKDAGGGSTTATETTPKPSDSGSSSKKTVGLDKV